MVANSATELRVVCAANPYYEQKWTDIGTATYQAKVKKEILDYDE